jgi:hypothetical protein
METKVSVALTTVVVAKINEVEILASPVELGLVPVKPICEALGVDAKAQREKLNSNPLYSSVGVLSTATGADGKHYEMHCLPFEYCLAWMLGINSSNVKEEIRERLLEHQKKCVEVLKRHFIGNMRKQAEINQLEILSLERINELTESKNRINTQLKEEKEKLQKIRNERLDNQPSLFD